MVILLVVAMHSAVCYSGLGGWYYIEGAAEKLHPAEFIGFAFFQSHLQAWFMGMLFFISGVFASLSLSNKGAAVFIKERLFRLGVPLLIYIFGISLFMQFVLLGNSLETVIRESDYPLLLIFECLDDTGPLWFNEALIIFCLFFALFSRMNSRQNSVSKPENFPGKRKLIVIIVGTGLAAFLVRLVFPIGTDVSNLQIAYFASYIVLFVLGTKAGKNSWLLRITQGEGRFWFITALALGTPLWFIMMICGGALKGNILIYGGLYWQSAAYALWEALVAIGFSLGLVWFFSRYCNLENTITRFMAANSFGVYMLHPPVLVAISLAFRRWEAQASLKFLIVTLLAITGSFCLSTLVRLIPQARVILK